MYRITPHYEPMIGVASPTYAGDTLGDERVVFTQMKPISEAGVIEFDELCSSIVPRLHRVMFKTLNWQQRTLDFAILKGDMLHLMEAKSLTPRLRIGGAASVALDQPPTVQFSVFTAVRRARMAARLRMLRRLPEDHDGEGAAAPIPASFDAALTFLPSITTVLSWNVTLSDEGEAVIEFENRETGLFADIAFRGDAAETVECYLRRPGVESILFEAPLSSDGVLDFLREAGISS